MLYWIAAAAVLLAGAVCFASSTKTFVDKTFQNFNEGELPSTSLSSDGKLTPAPAVKDIWSGEDDLIWRIIPGPDGAAFFSTGNGGKIYRMDSKGQTVLWCDLEEVAAFALALDAKGVLYAGAAPGGKIYSIKEKDKPAIFFETGEDYVWDIVFDSEGYMLAATGTHGKLYRIAPDGKGEVYYETPDKNIMDILILSKVKDNSIYIATHDKGRIYRVYEKDKAFVLYDTGMEEVRALAEGEEGWIYAALNAAKAGPPSPPSTPPTPAVKPDEPEDEAEGADDEDTPKDPQEAKSLSLPMVMGKMSAVIKMDIAGFAWPVQLMPETPIHFMIYDDKTQAIICGAGEKGKLYRVDGLNRHTLVFAAEEKYLLSCGRTGDQFLLGSGQKAKIKSVNWDDRKTGVFRSGVKDAGTASAWGKIRITGDFPKGTGVTVSTRSGNSKEADKTWSDWTKDENFEKDEARIAAPVARYYQYRLTLSGKNTSELPVVREAASFYLPPNRAPIIEEIIVAPAGKPSAPPRMPIMKKGEEEEGGKDEEKPEAAGGNSVSAKADSNPKKVRINWKVMDPEKDDMEHTLFFKGEKEAVWKKIKDKITRPNFEFTTSAIPDGRYQIKVLCSDLPSNPKTQAKESEFVSELFTVDNTPPHFVKNMSFDRAGKDAVVINAAIEDDLSLLTAAQYSTNAEDWFHVYPEDEIFDGRMESFSFLVGDLKQEELLVTLMVTDAEGNTAVEKILISLLPVK